MYFSATIFSLLGFTSPILTSLTVAATNFVCTLVALFIVDRVGRRAILLQSIPVMITGLVLCSVSVRLPRIYFTLTRNAVVLEPFLQGLLIMAFTPGGMWQSPVTQMHEWRLTRKLPSIIFSAFQRRM